MRTKQISLLSIWMLLAPCVLADNYVRQPALDVIHYDIALEFTEASAAIAGISKIQVRMREDRVSGMWLDFEDMVVDRLLVGGIEKTGRVQDGRLSFDFERTHSRNDVVLIEVHYHGQPRSGLLFENNKYGRRVIFADNWPDNAHHWFPSIDHPSDKATVAFSVTAPARYDVVANGRMGNTIPLPDGRKLTQWTEAKPIPTYCMAIGIAEFSVAQHGETAGVPLVWYSYPQDFDVVARKFSGTDSILAYFSQMIAPYPYEKLAQVQSTIGMGAMENSSAIFYGESSFEGNPLREEPVAHEIAHQWFGDSVTESDWDHLWLSEGFASYFEALYYEHQRGPEVFKETMARYAKKIMAYKHALTASIVDPAQTDLLKKLNPLNYEKGAWVLHMLRGILGDEKFFEGVRRYYAQYTGGIASSEDFQKIMESSGGIKLDGFFRQWLYQPGWPEYRVVWHWNESAGELEIEVRQTQTTGLYDMPLEIAIAHGGTRELHKFQISNTRDSFKIPLQAKPVSVEADPGGWLLKNVTVSQY
jgi:aminopeptidase N